MKPENLLLQRINRKSSTAQGGAKLTGPDDVSKPFAVGDLHLRLIDFGSALDKHSVEQLYGSYGPSDDEQTAEYAPPEVLLARWSSSSIPLLHPSLFLVPSTFSPLPSSV